MASNEQSQNHFRTAAVRAERSEGIHAHELLGITSAALVGAQLLGEGMFMQLRLAQSTIAQKLRSNKVVLSG